MNLFWTFCTCYRPQRSCGQGNVFTGVCLSTRGEGVCLSACWDARPSLDHADPPRPGRHPPRTRQTPPREADSSIRSMSGRYASYWNAFLYLTVCFECLRFHLGLSVNGWMTCVRPNCYLAVHKFLQLFIENSWMAIKNIYIFECEWLNGNSNDLCTAKLPFGRSHSNSNANWGIRNAHPTSSLHYMAIQVGNG